MRKIRRNCEFTYRWNIVLDGQPLDLTDIPKRLYLVHPRETKEIKEFKTIGNTISIEFTKYLLNQLGKYSLELHFILPDATRVSGERACAVDTDVCIIVGTTEEADDASEFTTTSDMAFGFQGDDAYVVWLKDNPEGTKQDYENWIRKPATDIAEVVGLQEAARIEAEEQRVEAEGLRQTNTTNAITAMGNAVGLAITDMETATGQAIQDANTATGLANTAAENADTAREAIQDDLARIESGLISRYVHSQNLECFITSYDSTTGTFYTESNPFVNGRKVGVTLNSLFDASPRASLYTPTGLATGGTTTWYIINATSTSFQLSASIGGAVNIFANNPTQDLSKWKFEQPIGRGVTISNINRDRIRIVIEVARVSNNIGTAMFINGSTYKGIDVASATSSYSTISIPTRYSSYGLVDIEILINSNSSVFKMECNLFTENGNAVVNTASTYCSRIPITKVDTFMLDYFEPANGCTISIYKL